MHPLSGSKYGPTAKKTHDTVEEIPERVDVADVFLSSGKPPDIAEDVVRTRARCAVPGCRNTGVSPRKVTEGLQRCACCKISE